MKIKHVIRMSLFAVGACLGGMVVPAQAAIADHVQRGQVGQIDVLVYPMDVKNVVTMVGSMPLGDAVVASRADNPAVPGLTAMMLQRGTRNQDKFEIAETLSSMGAHAGMNSGKTEVSIFAKSLKKDIGTVMKLLADELRHPAFDPDEFAKARAQMKAGLQQSADSPNTRAYEMLAGRLFDADNPNAPVPRKAMLAAVDKVTLDQLKAFHDKYYGPRHMTLVFAGDVDFADIKRQVADAFGGWSGGVDYVREAPPSPRSEAADLSVPMRDKASVSVMWGQTTGLHYSDEEFLPLRIGVSILGEGFTGRLMSTVRDDEGLTYGIGASLIGSDIVDGGFLMNATFAPELLDKGIASAGKQLRLWADKGVTAKELDARKASLIGQFQLQMGDTYGMAQTLMLSVKRGVGPAWLDQYQDKVRATTLKQVNEAIRTHVDPSRMVLVKAGTFKES